MRYSDHLELDDIPHRCYDRCIYCEHCVVCYAARSCPENNGSHALAIDEAAHDRLSKQEESHYPHVTYEVWYGTVH